MGRMVRLQSGSTAGLEGRSRDRTTALARSRSRINSIARKRTARVSHRRPPSLPTPNLIFRRAIFCSSLYPNTYFLLVWACTIHSSIPCFHTDPYKAFFVCHEKTRRKLLALPSTTRHHLIRSFPIAGESNTSPMT